MIWTEDTKKAVKLMFEAHKNQVDKSGIPNVFHPFHLAEQMKDENSVIVALLHDVIEDIKFTLDDIKEFGFNQEIYTALTLLTHDKSVPYMKYIDAIKDNPLASAVKLADLKHNSDLTRLNVISTKDAERIEKYKNAIQILTQYTIYFSMQKTIKKFNSRRCRDKNIVVE